MANKEAPKKKFSRKRFFAAMALRNTSIRKMGANEGGVGCGEKTIRRAANSGLIKKELLEAIAKYLDVEPDYLTGKYDERFSKLFPEPRDEETERIFESMLAPEKFPYHDSQKKDLLYDRFLDSVLMLHDISPRQMRELSEEKQRQFQLDMEMALCPVIQKYFNHDAKGRDGLPDLYRIAAEIENYNPDEPEPTWMFYGKSRFEDK